MRYGVSLTRSVGDIVESLKSSFRDVDYSAAVSELTAREEGLRWEKVEIAGRLGEKCDRFRARCASLERSTLKLVAECHRLSRDRDECNEKLSDLQTELSFMKEKDERAKKRFDWLLNEVRVMEEDKMKLILEKGDLMIKVAEQNKMLSQKEVMIEDFQSSVAEINAKLGVFEELGRLYGGLKMENERSDAHVQNKSEKDERVEELLNMFQAMKDSLQDKVRALRHDLEAQRSKVDAQQEERKRNDFEKTEQIKKLESEKNEFVRRKDEQIQELVKKESLNLQKWKLSKKLGIMDKRDSKLEKDVVNCICSDSAEEDKRIFELKLKSQEKMGLSAARSLSLSITAMMTKTRIPSIS